MHLGRNMRRRFLGGGSWDEGGIWGDASGKMHLAGRCFAGIFIVMLSFQFRARHTLHFISIPISFRIPCSFQSHLKFMKLFYVLYLAPCAKNEVPRSRYPVPGTRHIIPGIKHQMPGTRCLEPGTRRQVRGTRYQVWYQVPGTRKHLVADTKCLVQVPCTW